LGEEKGGGELSKVVFQNWEWQGFVGRTKLHEGTPRRKWLKGDRLVAFLFTKCGQTQSVREGEEV